MNNQPLQTTDAKGDTHTWSMVPGEERFLMVDGCPFVVEGHFRNWYLAGTESDPSARLLGQFCVTFYLKDGPKPGYGPNDAYWMHAELIAVKVHEPSPLEKMVSEKRGDQGWEAADPEFAPYLDELPAAIGDSQTTWGAIEIGGRRYVMILTPTSE